MITANEAKEITEQGKKETFVQLIARIERDILRTAKDSGQCIYTDELLPEEAVEYFREAGFNISKEKICVSSFFDLYRKKVHKITW